MVTGAHGQLGNEMQRLAERDTENTYVFTDVAELDITDLDAIRRCMTEHRISIVVNCAAYTNVDKAEDDEETAGRINHLAVENLAVACKEQGAVLIHVSTDYVFSGKENGGVPLDESALPAPVSAYGRTKLLGEQYVRQFCPRSFVVRTAWLYSHTGKNFVFTMVNAGRKLGALTVVNDQLGNPTNAADLAHHLLKLAVSSEYGTYHCTGEGVCSWYDFACEIIRLSGVKATVAPCTSAEYAAAHPDAASRPAWSALENRMLACTVGNEMRPWQEALTEFFKNESPEA